MYKDFCKVLVEKNIICKGTVFAATVTIEGVGGTKILKQIDVIVEAIDNPSDRLTFTCRYPNTKHYVIIIPSQILSVDGMEPERLGKTFNVNLDGSFCAPGKKRGRKPKNK